MVNIWEVMGQILTNNHSTLLQMGRKQFANPFLCVHETTQMAYFKQIFNVLTWTACPWARWYNTETQGNRSYSLWNAHIKLLLCHNYNLQQSHSDRHLLVAYFVMEMRFLGSFDKMSFVDRQYPQDIQLTSQNSHSLTKDLSMNRLWILSKNKRKKPKLLH